MLRGMKSAHRPSSTRRAALVGLVSAAFFTLSPASAQQAPMAIYSDPNVSGMIHLPGDLVRVSYGAGNLDRAARLQFLFEPLVRTLNRWADTQVVLTVYALTAEEWRQAQIGVPYGVPVRIGRSGLAVPAEGNDEVLRLWSQMRTPLPASQPGDSGGIVTPQFASSLVMADYLSIVLVGEIYADQLRILTSEWWLRGLVSHVIAGTYVKRERPEVQLDLERLYGTIVQQRPPRALAASDYRKDNTLADYLWFQSQFFFGAQTLLDDEGRGSIKRLRKLTKKGEGTLLGAAVMDEYQSVRTWYHDNFAAVSTIPR